MSLSSTRHSSPFPAQSAFVHFGIADPHTASTVSHYDLLRIGQLRRFNLSESQGLVSLPSFHLMLALLLAYALRHVRDVFPVSIGMNAVTIVSTPTQGRPLSGRRDRRDRIRRAVDRRRAPLDGRPAHCRDRRAACDASDLTSQRRAAGPRRFPQF
ncbi:phosphatase PAP2 family protein [Burkholderia stabilis]|uniref:phosphatase PAP2 family protein n=1 Tax=Burkholderia stabilis TaxID=95485 RepID=UPI001E307CD0|nr:phosphatase PAP2 family protein [Burkholderia stabilis]